MNAFSLPILNTFPLLKTALDQTQRISAALSSLLIFTRDDWNVSSAHTFQIKGLRDNRQTTDNSACVTLSSTVTGGTFGVTVDPLDSSPEYRGVVAPCGVNITWKNLRFPVITRLTPTAIPLVGLINITVAGAEMDPQIRVKVNGFPVADWLFYPKGAVLPSSASAASLAGSPQPSLLRRVWGSLFGGALASTAVSIQAVAEEDLVVFACLLYTSPSPRD